MNKEFLIGLTAVTIILLTAVIVMLGVYGVVTAPATVYCNSSGCNKRIVHSLPDGYNLNFKNPYNVIDTENGIDVVFHFSKED